MELSHSADPKTIACKTLSAITYLLGGNAKISLTRSQIFAALFLADDAHLQSHKHTITFDRYDQCVDGICGLIALDLLEGRISWDSLELSSPPWQTVSDLGKVWYSIPKETSLTSTLALSERHALAIALLKVNDPIAGYQI